MIFKSQIICGQQIVSLNTGGFVMALIGECSVKLNLVDAFLQSFLQHFAECYHLATHQ